MRIIDMTDDDFRALVREEIDIAMNKRYDRVIGTREVAELLGLSVPTIKNYKRLGKITPITPPGARPKYSMNEVLQFKQANTKIL